MVRATTLGRRGLGLLLLLTAAPGCVTTTTAFCFNRDMIAPAQVQATWDNRVRFTTDPTRGGATQPVLAGRLYLFGPELDSPLIGDGKVVIDLYDLSPGGKDLPAERTHERWDLDPATLAKFRRKDVIGEGYTLVLPWATFRPDVTQVKMTVCYVPAKGTPLYGEPALVTLNGDTPLTITEQVMPASHRSVPKR